MKNKLIRFIDILLIITLLFSQTLGAFANTDILPSAVEETSILPALEVEETIEEKEEPEPEVLDPQSELEKADSEEVLAIETEASEANEEGQESSEELEEVTSNEARSSEPLLARLAPRLLLNATNETVLDYTEGFTYFIDPGLPETVKENDKLYLQWHYQLTSIKPNDMTNRFLGNIYNHFSTTKDMGLGQTEVVEVKRNGQAISNYTTVSTSHEDLMQGKTVVIDPKADTETTVYEIVVRAPVEEIRSHYGMDFTAESTFNVPATSVISDPTSSTGTRVLTKNEVIKSTAMRRETINASTSGDTNLREINNQGVSVYIQSTVFEEQIIAGDYTSERNIKWLISQANSSKTEKTFPLSLNIDASQTVDEVKVYYYRPDDKNGYVLERVETANSSLNEVTLPAGYMAQVAVKTSITEEKANHKLGEAELEGLKADLSIEKVWQEGSKPVQTQYKLTGGKDNALDETITIRAGAGPFVKANLDKFSGFDKSAKRLAYDVVEIKQDGTELVYTSYDEKNLNYIFMNKTITEEVSTGVCTNYGVTSIDTVVINEYFSVSRDGRGIHSYGGKLSGRFRIPKEAKAGDYFILELPKEIKIRDVPDISTKFFDIFGNNQKIGEVFHYEQNKLKFVLNENAYSTKDYGGTFTIGEKINIQAKGVQRVDGNANFNRAGNYYTGIEPERIYFNNPRSPQATSVGLDLKFHASYYDRKRIDEKCDKTISTIGRVSYNDAELNKYGGLYKTVAEIGDDYVTYELLLNLDGKNGWADGLFIDQLTDTIELYNGNRPSSLRSDIQIYEVTGLRNLAYVAGSEKQIYPSRDAGTTSNVSVFLNNWNGSRLRKNEVYGGMRNVNPTDHITFNFSNTQSKTMLIRMKTKLLPNYEDKYNGSFYNFLWTDKKNKFGRTAFDTSKYDFMGVEENLTSGAASGRIVIKEPLYQLQIEKVDTSGRLIANNAAVFRLTDKDGQKIGDYFTEKTGQLTIGGLKRYFKDSSGSKGIYYLEEIEAPTGFIKDDTAYKILIDNDERIFFGKKGLAQNEDEFLREIDISQPIQIVNKKAYVVKIKKVDDANNSLVGAKFNLKNNTETFNITTSESKTQSEFTFYNLEVGEYTLTEVETPNGYLGRVEPIRFKITPSGEVEMLSETSSDFYTKLDENERLFELFVVNVKAKLGEFTLNKISKNGAPLEGAIFRLTPLKLGEETVEKTSTTSGKVQFSNLKAGKYRLEEIEAPKGYQKTKDTWLVEVDARGRTVVKVEATGALVANKSKNPDIVNFDVINEKDPYGFELPKTGGKGVTLIKVFGLLVILGAGYLLMRKKKKP